MAGGKKQVPDAVPIAICFAIPPAFGLMLAYAPIVLVWFLIGCLWFGMSALFINLWFAGR